MLPVHLKDKTAVQIVYEARRRFFQQDDVVEIDFQHKLEALLLQAVEHAIMNADEVQELLAEGQYNAMPRAVAFLNMVLPE